MSSKEEGYRIQDWTPPWLDNGEALLEIIKVTRKIDDPISWQIICSLLQRQMEIDLKIAREVNFMFNPDMNEDALPYAWEADINLKSLGMLEKRIQKDEDKDDDL